MTAFEPQISGVGSDCPTSRATTTAPLFEPFKFSTEATPLPKMPPLKIFNNLKTLKWSISGILSTPSPAPQPVSFYFDAFDDRKRRHGGVTAASRQRHCGRGPTMWHLKSFFLEMSYFLRDPFLKCPIFPVSQNAFRNRFFWGGGRTFRFIEKNVGPEWETQKSVFANGILWRLHLLLK